MDEVCRGRGELELGGGVVDSLELVQGACGKRSLMTNERLATVTLQLGREWKGADTIQYLIGMITIVGHCSAVQCSAVIMLRLLRLLQMLLLLPPNEGYLDPLHQVYTYLGTYHPVSPTKRSRMKVLSPLEERSCSCNGDPDYLVLSSAPRCPSCGLPPLPNIIVNAPTHFHHYLYTVSSPTAA